MASKTPIFSALTLGIILGFLIGITISNWTVLSPEFFNFRLVEIIQIFTTIIIAAFIVYLINSRINNELGKKKLVLDLIQELQEKIQEIFVIGSKHMNSFSEKSRRIILLNFKNANNLVFIVRNIKNGSGFKELENNRGTLFENYLLYEQSLTDDPFTQPKGKYSDSQRTFFINNYQVISRQLYQLSFLLFS